MTRTRFLARGGSVFAAAAVALAFAAPAQAQRYYPPPPPPLAVEYPVDAYGEDIVVYGSYRLPDDVTSASQRVGYGDLDLYYREDRRELRRRVSLTARDLCDRLGESDNSGSVLPSCRDAATRDALRRVGTPAENWAPRGTAWIAPPRWRQPPPPVRWIPPPPPPVWEPRYDPCGCR